MEKTKREQLEKLVHDMKAYADECDAKDATTPEDVQKLYERAKYLEHRSVALAESATVASHQYAIALSDLHDVLLRMRRQVNNASGKWPEITKEWKLVLEFFAQMFPGPDNDGFFYALLEKRA